MVVIITLLTVYAYDILVSDFLHHWVSEVLSNPLSYAVLHHQTGFEKSIYSILATSVMYAI